MNLNLGYTQLIISTCREYGLDDRDTSYVLATTRWETANTMEPVKEAYYLGSKAEAYRKKLRYYPWYGRGFIQLTWKENYEKAAKKLGMTKWTADTFLAPSVSAKVLVQGMKEGWFTGKKLSDYKTHYSSRAIVNGDKDKLHNGRKIGLIIEDYAKEYYKALQDKPARTPTPVEETEHPFLTLLKTLFRMFFR